MKRVLVTFIVGLITTLIPLIAISETIDVHIKGVDDGVKTSKQQDYKEAVMNAKLQAVERAGVEIKSITRVINFQTKFDMVESKANAVLLPGFKVIDVGYLKDGTYQIVLFGKVRTVEESIDSKELRYAQSLVKRGKRSQAKRIIDNIISNSKDDVVVAEAMYYQVLWKFSPEEHDTYEKLKAYYPNSKYVSRLETLLAERELEWKRLDAEREAERKRLAAEREAERKRLAAETVLRWKRLDAEREAERKRLAAERELERKRLEAEREAERKRLAAEREAERKRLESMIGKVIGKDGRFIAGDKGIVLDTKYNLMWVAISSKTRLNWSDAKRHTANYRGGGYTDWRLPTKNELNSLRSGLSRGNGRGIEREGTRCITPLIQPGSDVWGVECSLSKAILGQFDWESPNYDGVACQAKDWGRFTLPVRDVQ